MKILIFVVVALIAIIGISFVQIEDKPTKQIGAITSDYRTVSIEFPPVLETDNEVIFKIPIKNKGKNLIFFDKNKLSTSCTCLSVDLDIKSLQPEEESIIKMKGHLYGRSGPMSFKANFIDSLNGKWEIEAKTFIYRTQQFQPEIFQLGEIEGGKEIVRELLFVQAGNSIDSMPYRPKFNTNIENFNIIVGQESIEKIKEGLFIRKTPLTFIGKTSYQSTKGFISPIEGTAKSTDYFPHLDISWDIKGDLEFYPKELIMPISKSCDILERKVYIKLRKDFVNLEFESPNKELIRFYSDYKKGDKNFIATVSCDTSKVKKSYEGFFTVKENGLPLPFKLPIKLINP